MGSHMTMDGSGTAAHSGLALGLESYRVRVKATACTTMAGS